MFYNLDVNKTLIMLLMLMSLTFAFMPQTCSGGGEDPNGPGWEADLDKRRN